MPVEIRNPRRQEMPAVVSLWDKVFGVGEPFFWTLLDGETKRKLTQTWCVFADGEPVSSLHYFVRPTYGLQGELHRMGGIGSVCTLEEHRGKGYSAELLRRVIAEMKRDGCKWSLLFTGVNPHYAKHGWQTIPYHSKTGTVSAPATAPSGWKVKELDPRDPRRLGLLARIHHAYNEGRPLTHARTAKSWKHAHLYRLTQPGGKVWVASKPGLGTCAYAAIRPDWGQMNLIEIGHLPGADEGLLALAESVKAEVRARGIEKMGVNTPDEPSAQAMVNRLLEAVEVQEHGHMMGLSLSPEVDDAYLRKLFADPRRVHWTVDDF